MNLDGLVGDYPSVETVRRNALLVVQAQLGDRRALAELVGYWHDPLWCYVRHMLNGPTMADDVSQEVWASVLKALPGLRQQERFALALAMRHHRSGSTNRRIAVAAVILGLALIAGIVLLLR